MNTHKFPFWLKIFFFFLLFFNWFCVRAQLAGCYYVGTLGWENYSSLTNSGGLFSAINTNGLSGDILVLITTDLPSETGSIALNSCYCAYSITVMPADSVLKTITYSGDCSAAMIRLNDVDNFTIDGRYSTLPCAYQLVNGNYLRFESSCGSRPVMEMNGDCENATLRNIIVASDNSSLSTISGGAINIRSSQVNGSDNFRLMNSILQDFNAPATLFFGVQINAPSAANILSGMEISNNHFKNVNGKGIMLTNGIGNIDGSLIQNNHFYADLSISGPGAGWEYAAIQIESGSGHNVRSNRIGGQSNNCSGPKLNISFNGGSEFFTPIRITNLVPNNLVNLVDSNIIRNLFITGNSSIPLNVTIIRIEGGNCNVGSIDGNRIGEINTDAGLLVNASIGYAEGYNGAGNEFRVVYSTSGGVVNVENNITGGILLQQSTTTGCNANLLYSNNSTTNFRNNTIGGVANNIVKESAGNFRCIYSNTTNSLFDINENIISGITALNGFNEIFFSIRVIGGSGQPVINGNQVSGISIGNGTNQPRMYGIDSDHPFTIAEANSLSGITVNSSYPGTQFYGITINAGGGDIVIKDNRLSNISLLSSASVQTNLVAINTSGNSTFSYDANFIERLQVNSGSNSSYIRGININTATQNELINNVVLIDNGLLGNDIFIYGIYDNCSGGINNIWHNTSDTRGTASGSRRSACYFRTDAATRNIQNNIFNNLRTGGTGGHYAMYHNTTDGVMLCNYNLHYTEENANRLIRYTSDRSFANWQTTGYDLNSITSSVSQVLVNFSTGQQTTTAGNDIGNNGLGIIVDHINAFRPQDAGYDMGAFEIPNSILSSPLPIELLSFEAKCEERKAQISWSTASEINNDYFSLERSFDGINWLNIARIEGAGFSSQTLNYSFSDYLPDELFADIKYYRLFQTDYDGKTKYIGMVAINCEESNATSTECFSVVNNPVSLNSGGILFLHLNNCFAGKTRISLTNPAGQLVFDREADIHDKNTTIDICLPGWIAEGAYLLSLKGKNTMDSQWIFVVN